MQKRRTLPGVFVGALILAAVIAALAASGRISALTQSWDTLTGTLKEMLPSVGEPSSQPSNPSPNTSATGLRHQTAPLSSAQLSSPLLHGPFVSACGAPDEMKVVAEVTVKMGRAVGVSVKSYPSDPAVSLCIDRAIRELEWDVSPKTDRVTVTY